MIAIDSKFIEALGYEVDTKELFIKFHSGTTIYVYENVEQNEFNRFVIAPSSGKYFRENIFDKYDYYKLTR